MGKNTTFGRQSKIEMRPILATNRELKIRTSYPKIQILRCTVGHDQCVPYHPQKLRNFEIRHRHLDLITRKRIYLVNPF